MLPNFVIIGAAKAGTTALYHYLSSHPDVYMSPLKETNFFAYGVGPDGQLEYGDPELHKFTVTDMSDYEQLFSAVRGEPAIGEASPIYLEAPNAASHIHEAVPDMRIICGLRDPVDRAYSDYQMYLRNRGRRLEPDVDLVPGAAWTQPDSHWMALGRYHDQLARYYELFGPSRILVYLFDDLRSDALSVFHDICDFLGVDPDFVPDLATPHNVGGVPRSMGVERVLTSKRLRRVIEPLVPRSVVDRVRQIRTANLERAPRIPESLRAEMAAHFVFDLKATSELIGRSLDTWVAGSPGSSRQ